MTGETDQADWTTMGEPARCTKCSSGSDDRDMNDWIITQRQYYLNSLTYFIYLFINFAHSVIQ